MNAPQGPRLQDRLEEFPSTGLCIAAESWRRLNSVPSLPAAGTTSLQGPFGEKGEEMSK